MNDAESLATLKDYRNLHDLAASLEPESAGNHVRTGTT